jgi:hypothetical protein
MGKFLFVHSRNGLTQSLVHRVEAITKKLSNEAETQNRIFLKRDTNHFIGITNLFEHWEIIDFCLCAGLLINKDKSDWRSIPRENLNGSFAIIRQCHDFVEAITDFTGTKTLWYFIGEEFFGISNSQRMLNTAIGEFKFNDIAIPWVLSSGNLGPELSWHSSIQRLANNSVLRINKKNHSFQILDNLSIKIDSKDQLTTDSDVTKAILHDYDQVHQKISIDLKKWLLPLSGGYDSRAIALFFKRNNNSTNLKTVTWGEGDSINEEGTDAYTARHLAEKLDLSHKYYITDLSNDSFNASVVADRFIRFGEGRIDHIAGYLDGFKMWKDFYDDGVQGIFRGDKAFYEEHSFYSPYYVRAKMGFGLTTDYTNFSTVYDSNFPAQKLPEKLRRVKSESMYAFTEKAYYNFRLPSVLSALNDLKLPYVDVFSPLLCRENILLRSRIIKEYSMTKNYRQLLEGLSQGIPIANKESIINRETIMQHPDFLKLYYEALDSEIITKLIPVEIIDNVRSKINQKDKNKEFTSKRRSSKEYLFSIIVTRFSWFYFTYQRFFKKKKTINSHILAFRIFMIYKMWQVLNEDIDTVSQE